MSIDCITNLVHAGDTAELATETLDKFLVDTSGSMARDRKQAFLGVLEDITIVDYFHGLTPPLARSDFETGL